MKRHHYFAGLAMQELLRDHLIEKRRGGEGRLSVHHLIDEGVLKNIACLSRDMADKMCEELNKPKGQ